MSHAAAPILVIHGGAGVVRKEMTPEKEKAVRAGLEKARRLGRRLERIAKCMPAARICLCFLCREIAKMGKNLDQ